MSFCLEISCLWLSGIKGVQKLSGGVQPGGCAPAPNRPKRLVNRHWVVPHACYRPIHPSYAVEVMDDQRGESSAFTDALVSSRMESS